MHLPLRLCCLTFVILTASTDSVIACSWQDELLHWRLDPKDYNSALHVIFSGGQYRCSLQPRQHCFTYSPPEAALDKLEICCKAARKLDEALFVLGMSQHHFRLALDLGECHAQCSYQSSREVREPHTPKKPQCLVEVACCSDRNQYVQVLLQEGGQCVCPDSVTKSLPSTQQR